VLAVVFAQVPVEVIREYAFVDQLRKVCQRNEFPLFVLFVSVFVRSATIAFIICFSHEGIRDSQNLGPTSSLFTLLTTSIL
jgi:hypothetical protein